MQILKKALFIVASAFGLVAPILANDLAMEDESFWVDPAENFYSVIHSLDQYFAAQEEGLNSNEADIREYRVDLSVSKTGITMKSCKRGGHSRNYLAPVSSQERKDIRYIVTTLARDSLASLATSRSSLKKVGDRIDHIHPLKFLSTVFTDEELKAGVHAIRDRGWVWDEFAGGLIGSLREEAANQNMKMQFIEEFAQTVGINIYFILPPIQESRWKDFINTLIDRIPRANDPNRYNM